jgi:signal transduction histidine kinase
MAASTTLKSLSPFLSSRAGTKVNEAPVRNWLPVVVLVLTTSAAFGADIALGTFASEATDAFYIVAAAASAYAGGWRFGIVSVALGLAPNLWLFNTAHYSLAIGFYGWEHIIVTSMIAAILAVLVGRIRSEQRALLALNNQLEDRVQERTADLEESNRQLEAFCHTLAHDLRAPLRAIEGFSEITLTENVGRLTTDGEQMLMRIGRSAEAMNRLVRDLLEYTHLSRREITVTPINLEEAVDRVLQIVGPEITEKKGAVEVCRPLPNISANFVMVEQTILILVSNALKFTRDNVPPRIRIEAERRNDSIRLVVADNGIGISEPYQERIFGPFQRLDTQPKYPGTGMGLAIAKKTVEQLGGKIGVESDPNRGSRFWIELPAA